jgi:hypothetical protein
MRKGRARTAAKVVVLLSTLLRFAGRKFDNLAADGRGPRPFAGRGGLIGTNRPPYSECWRIGGASSGRTSSR